MRHGSDIKVHYHFMREQVVSNEVELVYVPMDRKMGDVFTKHLKLDKLLPFSGMLGLQHLDMPNLRGRVKLERWREIRFEELNQVKNSMSEQLKKLECSDNMEKSRTCGQMEEDRLSGE